MSRAIYRRITKKASRTFYWSALFLPKDIRDDVFKLYSYLRSVDDLIDSQPQKMDKYYNYKKLIFNSYKGIPSQDPIIVGFTEVAQKYKFPIKWSEDFFRGQEMDIKDNVYDNFDDLKKYMYGVAGVVGLMMAKIMNLTQYAYVTAQFFGESLQYLNIIRDVQEDYRNQRIYLPQDDLKKYNLDSHFLKNVNQNKFNKLIRCQLDRFYSMMAISKSGFKYIPKKYLYSIKTSADIYMWSARQIYKRPTIILDKKVRPSQAKVIFYLIKNIFSTYYATQSYRISENN